MKSLLLVIIIVIPEFLPHFQVAKMAFYTWVFLECSVWWLSYQFLSWFKAI